MIFTLTFRANGKRLRLTQIGISIAQHKMKRRGGHSLEPSGTISESGNRIIALS